MLTGIIPLFGLFIRRIWGQSFYRKHYGGMLSSWGYLKRAVRATLLEKTMAWHMGGRFTDERALRASKQIWRSALHLPFSILPVGLDRFITDWEYTKDRLYFFLIRPFRLYFNRELLEEWLRDIVMEGRQDHLLTADDADVILSQVQEPFIQKYLKSLAVHLLTLPITQIVSVIVAGLYVALHPEMPRAQAYGIGLGIIALFQVTPVSPGSLARGLYVVYLVIKEKNFKDYNIAVFLGFFKYIGYLAFPIQMAYRYPALARFMAAHWASGAVHVVPVFGERGAWLEHFVYNMFYNWPLTIRRRMRSRAEMRSALKPRYWHVALCIVGATAVFGLADFNYLRELDRLPTLKEIWWLVIAVPFLCGVVVTLGAGGSSIRGRAIAGALAGAAVGVLYTAVSTVLGGGTVETGAVTASALWRFSLFTLLSTLGVMITELMLPGND